MQRARFLDIESILWKKVLVAYLQHYVMIVTKIQKRKDTRQKKVDDRLLSKIKCGHRCVCGTEDEHDKKSDRDRRREV